VRRTISAVWLFWLLFAFTGQRPNVLSAQTAPQPQQGADVKLHDTLVFRIWVDRPPHSATERAREVAHALERAFDAGFNDVRVDVHADAHVVFVGDVPVVTLHESDARAVQSASLDVYTANVAAQMRSALQIERRRSDIAGTVFSISLVVFFAFVALVSSRRLGELASRARDAIIERPERIVPIRFNKLEVLGADSLRALLLSAVIIGRWALQVGLIYVWLALSLSRFELTRPYTDKLNHAMLEPLSALAQRALGALPIVILTFALAAVVFVLVRIVELFFKGAAHGREHVIRVPRDLMGAVSALIRMSIVVLALVFAGPIVSGDPEGVLARLGMGVLLGVSLALTPLFCSAACGGVLIFTRRLQVGRQIELGKLSGRITSIRLLDMVLRDSDGSELRVPHLRTLFTPLRVLAAERRRSVELAVSPRAEPGAVIALLMAALGDAGAPGDHAVELTDIDADAARYKVSVPARDARSASDLRLLLAQALVREQIALGRVSGAAHGGAEHD
jgi:small conductance mechanosensitive channel